MNDPELASRLRLAITRMARRLRQQGDPALSPSLVAALSTIERLGPLTPSELAEAERVQRPTVTRLAARLADAGLIERSSDEHDARVARLAVSGEGRRVLKALRTRKTAYLARRLERLDTADRAALERAADVLERLLDEDA
ncbi:MAG: MarR family transcriptional regulator [Thermoleophilaceae bacterium]